MAARKPKIEYYWTPRYEYALFKGHFVNWRLVGANGEVMCQSTQGFRDKPDAQRSVLRVFHVLCGLGADIPLDGYGLSVREVGPGRKPS